MEVRGSCHCGEVKFRVQGAPEEVMDCNCSLCLRRGSLLWFVSADDFQLETSDDALATYTFNQHHIRHRFCRRCGIHPFGQGTDPASGAEMVAINARCLEDVDLDALQVKSFDGRAL